ncbi:MAG: Ribosome maturation factor RimP [Candidatus Dichloromethanomonas elyunquensis]|nr:MAG: Ribosome maturation factor RimP [Candidatus Dichloromethanomonas elyunquensis]
MSKSVLSRVRELAEPEINGLGLELVDVEYVKEGVHWYLRIYIDKEGGVDIDDCAVVSHRMSEILDRENLIPQAYMLEVSSPGIERPLRKKEDYEKYKGELVSIYSSEPYQGFICFTGNLVGLVEDHVILEHEKQEIAIPFERIERAHLTFEF